MKTLTTTLWRPVAIVAAVVALGACSGDMSDLRAYIDEVKARPGGIIAPLPQVVPAPSFTYEAGQRRSPFMPETPQTRASNNPDAIRGPDPNRPREFLEQFPLDTLRMVGTMAGVDGAFGLVQTSDGLIYRVKDLHELGEVLQLGLIDQERAAFILERTQALIEAMRQRQFPFPELEQAMAIAETMLPLE